MTMEKEESILFQDAIVVKLGGKEYQVKPLVIKRAREWRKHVVGSLNNLPEALNTDTDDPAKFTASLNLLLVTSLDNVIDLFFEYAIDLDRQEIEDSATEKELADAFNAVIEIAFPLSKTLGEVMQRISH